MFKNKVNAIQTGKNNDVMSENVPTTEISRRP